MDTIFLRELEVNATIGIFEWEKRIKQKVRIDLEMATNIAKAAASDSIEDTLDYKAISKRIIQFVEDSSYELIETLIEKISEILLKEFNIPWVRLTISKPGAVRGSRDVGITIERGQRTPWYKELTMARVYVSIGSNIDKEKNILSSINALREHFGDLDISKIYESQAVGFEGDDFHNLVVGFDTDQSPLEISNILKQIEADHDRTRGKEKFESRTLDLDQLLYGDLVMQMEGVNIPHPDILRYNFVLKPLNELAGEVEHPEEEKTIKQLWDHYEDKGDMKVIEY